VEDCAAGAAYAMVLLAFRTLASAAWWWLTVVTPLVCAIYWWLAPYAPDIRAISASDAGRINIHTSET